MKKIPILPTLAILTLLGAACARESTYIETDDTTTRVIREEGADTRDLTYQTETAADRAIESTGTALEEAGREMRETTTTPTTTTTTQRP